MATFSSGVKCFRSFLIRSLRYLNGRTLSPFPTEAGQEYLQSVRYKLQKRIRRQKSTGFETYILVLKQLWQFVDGESALIALQAELAQRCPSADSVAETIIQEGFREADQKGLLSPALASEIEWAAVSMGVLRRFSDLDDSRNVGNFLPSLPSDEYDDHISAFSDFYLTPF